MYRAVAILIGILIVMTVGAAVSAAQSQRESSAPEAWPPACRVFISDVQPPPGGFAADTAVITVQFTRAMNPASINQDSIAVTQAKYSRRLSDAFRILYSQRTHELKLEPKHPLFNFGTGNQISVTVKGRVSDVKGNRLDHDCTWSFRT